MLKTTEVTKLQARLGDLSVEGNVVSSVATYHLFIRLLAKCKAPSSLEPTEAGSRHHLRSMRVGKILVGEVEGS
ncbi:hypothetical protein PF005_g6226 [Phytophthora fragariae]|uniref:Uncharacterized protein n=1 Tax=Phytophthora fragariae TaxID=53985 RepID=A0A6A4A3A0_9STRA|nr:hypothetical protein PF007_g6362 [Phytophthora fragariae]KAE9125532.1 hypothetical protein PF010_g5595 [Phytophthora fragariae]KAE9150034.1 hypothetical protein PF006_g5548 [Phytophthora fragariae]KAE9223666.1 hypothetical protein PF005_g6226 [Phytophthora fragariae]KAE9245168.1 hypothetical protein PF004_g5365 [Phytophthora fragariae]